MDTRTLLLGGGALALLAYVVWPRPASATTAPAASDTSAGPILPASSVATTSALAPGYTAPGVAPPTAPVAPAPPVAPPVLASPAPTPALAPIPSPPVAWPTPSPMPTPIAPDTSGLAPAPLAPAPATAPTPDASALAPAPAPPPPPPASPPAPAPVVAAAAASNPLTTITELVPRSPPASPLATGAQSVPASFGYRITVNFVQGKSYAIHVLVPQGAAIPGQAQIQSALGTNYHVTAVVQAVPTYQGFSHVVVVLTFTGSSQSSIVSSDTFGVASGFVLLDRGGPDAFLPVTQQSAPVSFTGQTASIRAPLSTHLSLLSGVPSRMTGHDVNRSLGRVARRF